MSLLRLMVIAEALGVSAVIVAVLLWVALITGVIRIDGDE